MPETPPPTPRQIRFDAPALTLQRAEWGPPDATRVALLCHGWPESWRHWRHQAEALAAEGWRVLVPHQRGYAGSAGLTDPAQYTMLHLVGDMMAHLDDAGVDEAVVIGHDWGAALAWHCALLVPQRVRAVAGLSIPYVPPSPRHLMQALAARGITDFYMQRFQRIGEAEVEFERDVEEALRRVTSTLAGDAPDGARFGMPAPGEPLLARTVRSEQLPPWVDPVDFAGLVEEFKASGFVGGLNWYRNFERNAELLAPWHGQPIRQPSLFIAGERDGVLRFPGAARQLEQLPTVLPGLRGLHLLPGAGHWVQRERAPEVSRLLLDFVRSR